MKEDASSQPLHFTINRFLAPRLLEAWRRIRFSDEVADRCVASITKRDRLGSRDRKRLAEAVFVALRRRGSTDALLGVDRASNPENASLWLATALEQPWPDGPAPLPFFPSVGDLSQTANLPPALIEVLADQYDSDQLLELGQALQKRAPTTLRCSAPRLDVQTALAAEGASTELCRYALAGLTCATGSQLHQISKELRHRFEIQDEGSQLLAALVGAKPGERVLDACAGAGGKTLALLESGAQVEASDTDSSRLGRLQRRALAIGHSVPTIVLSESGPLPFEAPFDRILIDAPCTGTGTARRAPDLLWRFTAERLAHYRAIQAQILARFAPLVRPGGVLIYATCSLVPEENEKQVEHFLNQHPDFTLAPPSQTLGDELAQSLDATTYLNLLPHKHGSDGFFGALLNRA